MATNVNNGPSPWSHPSTIRGILKLKQAQLEQEQPQKSEADQIWCDTVKRFWQRAEADQFGAK